MLEGFAFKDRIEGLGGNDLIGGGEGDDIILPGSGNDTVYGGGGYDTVVFSGNIADYTITIDDGPNMLRARPTTVISKLTGEVDKLYGVELMQFNDRALGNPIRSFAGTAGNDVFTIGSNQVVSDGAGRGFDHVNIIPRAGANGILAPYQLPDNIESVAATGVVPIDLIGNALNNSLYGTPLGESIDGQGGDDRIESAGGNDTVVGRAGQDVIFTASGDDYVDGGIGDDTIEAGGGDDTVVGGDGNDVIHGDNHEAANKVYQDTAPTSPATTPVANDMNVLFVSIDDLAPLFSMFEDSPFQALAPNIEAFFAQSAVFTSAFATAPLCNASRASILLGVDPNTSGIDSNESSLVGPRSIYQSLPSYLKDNGYLTAFTGKIFHNEADRGDPAAWSINDQYFRHFDWEPNSWDVQDAAIKTGSDTLPDGAFADGRNITNFEDFIGSNHSQPFFYGLGLYRPHAPLYVPQKYLDLYPLDSIVIPSGASDDLADLGMIARAIASNMNPGANLPDELLAVSNSTSELELKIYIQAYLGAISYADAMFGEAMAALEASAYGNNTAVVLWSDHGFHLGDKMAWGKFTLWDQGSRAPLAFHLPGQTTGQVIDNAVSLMDIYPTLAEMLGLEAPDHLMGNSLVPLINNPALAWDQPVLSELNGNYSIRSNAYRYIQYWDGTEELYQVGTDPHEITNLAGNPAYAAVLADMRQYLPAGNDNLSGNGGDDQIFGWGGNDRLDGGEGADQLHGGAGNDTLLGGAGNDFLAGNDGDDFMEGGGGNDEMRGRLGNDTYVYRDAGDQIVELAGEGRDRVYATVNATLAAHVEDLQLKEAARIGIGNELNNQIVGTNSDDQLFGMGGDDLLYGNGGNDRLDGGAGNDSLDGAGGNDEMRGGLGHDYYDLRDVGDTIIELANEGYDTISAAFAYTLPDNVEGLRLGVGVTVGTGNALNNTITGSGGTDTLSGLDGNDTIIGGLGADKIIGGAGRDIMTGGGGKDVFQFAVGDFAAVRANADVITDFNRQQGDKISLELIDANVNLAGKQTFQWVGANAFTGIAGQLHYVFADGRTWLEADRDGNRVADLVIRLDQQIVLSASDITGAGTGFPFPFPWDFNF